MPQPKRQAKGTGKRKAASPSKKKTQGRAPAGPPAARELSRAELEALREKLRRKFH